MSTITKTFKVDGAATNMTSVTLSDSTGTYGVKRNDNDAVVVADGTAMTNSSTGVYTHTFTDPADDLTYTYAFEVVYSGETYWITDTLTGPPSSDNAVTLTEAKLYARIDITEDDDLITGLITAAHKYCEDFTGRRFMNTTEVEYLDDFPLSTESIRPLRSPLSSVTSIGYVDSNGDSQTFSSDDYDVDTTSEPGRIALAYGEVWPTTRSDINAITLTYVAGYGATAASVPEGIKTAIKQLVCHWYDHRETVTISNVVPREIPLAVNALLWPYKVLEFK